MKKKWYPWNCYFGKNCVVQDGMCHFDMKLFIVQVGHQGILDLLVPPPTHLALNVTKPWTQLLKWTASRWEKWMCAEMCKMSHISRLRIENWLFQEFIAQNQWGTCLTRSHAGSKHSIRMIFGPDCWFSLGLRTGSVQLQRLFRSRGPRDHSWTQKLVVASFAEIQEFYCYWNKIVLTMLGSSWSDWFPKSRFAVKVNH